MSNISIRQLHLSQCVTWQLNNYRRAIIELTHVMHVFEIREIGKLYHDGEMSSQP